MATRGIIAHDRPKFYIAYQRRDDEPVTLIMVAADGYDVRAHEPDTDAFHVDGPLYETYRFLYDERYVPISAEQAVAAGATRLGADWSRMFPELVSQRRADRGRTPASEALPEPS